MENEPGLDLRDVFLIIKKQILLIVIITLVITLISAIISVFLISPTYEAQVGIIICKQSNGEKITDSDVNMYQNLMETYKDIAVTNYVAEQAVKKLGDGTEAKDLLDRTTVIVKTGTMILSITTQSNDSVKAYKDVQAYAESFLKRASELLPDGDIKIMDDAQIPETPTRPNKILIITAAFILGILLSVGTVFLLEYMNNTIVTKNDVEKYLELGVLGIIPENNEE